MSKRNKIIALVAATAFFAVLTVFFISTSSSYGTKYLYPSKRFHYQAARTLGHSIYQGAAPGEVFSVISRVEDGDVENWHKQWLGMGDRIEKLAESANDPVSMGNAYLRASNYYRASEFFMDTGDKNRLVIYNKSVDTFKKGLKNLGIKYQEYFIPYQTGKMRNYYFPGDKDKPLVFVCGGFDSTNEESFFL